MKTKRKPAEPTEENWIDGKYPFDFAECGDCLTFHLRAECGMAQHAPLREEIRCAILDRVVTSAAFLEKHYATLLALREKYDRFWPARGR